MNIPYSKCYLLTTTNTVPNKRRFKTQVKEVFKSLHQYQIPNTHSIKGTELGARQKKRRHPSLPPLSQQIPPAPTSAQHCSVHWARTHAWTKLTKIPSASRTEVVFWFYTQTGIFSNCSSEILFLNLTKDGGKYISPCCRSLSAPYWYHFITSLNWNWPFQYSPTSNLSLLTVLPIYLTSQFPSRIHHTIQPSSLVSWVEKNDVTYVNCCHNKFQVLNFIVPQYFYFSYQWMFTKYLYRKTREMKLWKVCSHAADTYREDRPYLNTYGRDEMLGRGLT